MKYSELLYPGHLDSMFNLKKKQGKTRRPVIISVHCHASNISKVFRLSNLTNSSTNTILYTKYQ